MAEAAVSQAQPSGLSGLQAASLAFCNGIFSAVTGAVGWGAKTPSRGREACQNDAGVDRLGQGNGFVYTAITCPSRASCAQTGTMTLTTFAKL